MAGLYDLFLEQDLEPEWLCLLWKWVLEWYRGRPRCGSRSAIEDCSFASRTRGFSTNGALKRFGQPLAAVRWDPPQGLTGVSSMVAHIYIGLGARRCPESDFMADVADWNSLFCTDSMGIQREMGPFCRGK